MKKLLAYVLVACMLTGLLPVFASAATVTMQKDKTYIVLGPESFAEYGAWHTAKDSGNFDILTGGTSGVGNSTKPATREICLPKDGSYKIYTLAKDFTTKPGARYFDVKLGDAPAFRTGNHGQEGYAWQSSDAISCFGGNVTVSVMDSSGNYARCAAIVITDDLNFNPTADNAAVKAMLAEKLYQDGDTTYTAAATAGRPSSEIAVLLNGEWMHFDVDPVLVNDRTMVPFRAIFEALGCTVSWDEESQTANGQRNGVEISLPIGSATVTVGGKGKTLDQPAILLNDRTLVPLRFVSEALGAQVRWDDSTQTVTILATVPDELVLFGQESFVDIGTWTLEASEEGAFREQALRGTVPQGVADAKLEDANTSGVKPAVANFKLSQGGTYRVWARSKDFAENQQGDRFFQLSFNDKPLMSHKYGTHGGTGYAWASGGTIELPAGENTLYVHDTSGFYARFDAVLLSKDLSYVPPEGYEALSSLVLPYDNMPKISRNFPNYANEQAVPTESTVLENAETKVVFYKVPTSKGQVVQNEIYAMHNGQWVRTKNRNEDLGYLVLKADAATNTVSQDKYGMTVSYTVNGKSYGGLTANPYNAGAPTFFVPTDYTVSGNSVILSAANEAGSITATWAMDETPYPMVYIDFVPNSDGYYTIGAWEGKGFATEQYEYALAPFRVQFKRVPNEPELMNEQYLFTPMGTYTLYENNEYGAYAVTKGVVFEPEWIPQRWVYKDNCLLGISMKRADSLHRGTAFAPVMGNADSYMTAGSNYVMRIRIVSDAADWFETYSTVVTDLFDVTDYRKNYNNSLNEVIYNTRNLMLDDKYGGWDIYDKAHYNMEGKNVTSVANSMEALQVYLLTEKGAVLEKRAIPTLANALTRGNIHFNRIGESGGANYWTNLAEPNPIGTPVSGFNANVVGGMYEMTRGGVPYLWNYAVEKGGSNVTNSYGSIASFSNDLAMYKYTGDAKYLESAKTAADEYLETVVYAESYEQPSWSSFIYISYYPNLANLVDIYEVTGEQKYLDAAEFVAEWMTTGLWVPGVDGEKKTAPVTVNDLQEMTARFHYGSETTKSMWWAGDKQMRIGREDITDTTHNNDIITSRTREVEGWLPSRVGLGIEQASTFSKSSNIVMQSFVGDFMKIAAYTGNGFLETAARNAIVGRFRSYDGYYRNAFITYPQESNYPYDGPDYTGIYWHHLTSYLAMLEDFLINQTFNWSGRNIEFPSVRQQGYAYFNSNQYGFAPGKFYDETDMWPWLDAGIVIADSTQIDYMAARKDGVLGIAFMNEDDVPTTSQFALGASIDGASDYNGTAILYDKTGKIGTVEVVNGKFTLTVPPKSLQAVTMQIPTVKAPKFAALRYDTTEAEIGATVTDHTKGKGYVLQMTPENYFAYVYTTCKPSEISKATLTYSVGGAKQTATADVYPFEFIIRVDNADAEFTYELSVTKTSGGTENLGGGTLMTAKKSAEKGIAYDFGSSSANAEAKALKFNPTAISLVTQGSASGVFRFVISKASLPFTPTETNVVGLTLTGNVALTTGEKEAYEGTITAMEDRGDTCVLVATVGKLSVSKYSSTVEGKNKYTWENLTIHPIGK